MSGWPLSAAQLANAERFRNDPTDPRHGTRNGYGNLYCRCDRCKRAHKDDPGMQAAVRKYRAKLIREGKPTNGSRRSPDRVMPYVPRPGRRTSGGWGVDA